MKTEKQKSQEIISWLANKPENQIATGVYVKKVGYKYVTVVNTWGTTTTEKIPIEVFYALHIEKCKCGGKYTSGNDYYNIVCERCHERHPEI